MDRFPDVMARILAPLIGLLLAALVSVGGAAPARAADTTPPAPTLTSPVPDAQFGARPTFTGTAGTGEGDASIVTVRLVSVAEPSVVLSVDASVPSGDGTFSVVPSFALPTGTWTLFVRQSDEAGNVGVSAAQPLTVDRARPDITVLQPGFGAILATATPVISGVAGRKAKDLALIVVDVYAGASPSGFAVRSSTEVADADGGFVAALDAPLPDGLYTVVARQQDNGLGEGTSARTFRVDTVAPTVAIDGVVDGAVVAPGDVVALSFACDDPGGAGIAVCAGPGASGAPLDTTTPGPRTVRVTAVDRAGNSTTAVLRYRVESAPVVLAAREPDRVPVTAAKGPVRVSPNLAITWVTVRPRSRSRSCTRAPRACPVAVDIDGMVDLIGAGKRVTVTATRGGRQVRSSRRVGRGAWRVTLRLPAGRGRWRVAAAMEGTATMLPSIARRTVVLTAQGRSA